MKRRMHKIVLGLAMVVALSVVFSGNLKCVEAATEVDSVTVDEWDYILYDDETAKVTNYSGTETEVSIPDKVSYEGIIYSVTTVGCCFTAQQKTLTSVIIPESVTSLEANAFEKCTVLKSVDLGGVTTIGDYAFTFCNKLKEIDLSKVTTVGVESFSYSGLTSADVASLTEIPKMAFYYCWNLPELTNTMNIKYVGRAAFMQCYNMKCLDLRNADTIEYGALDVSPPSDVDYTEIILSGKVEPNMEMFSDWESMGGDPWVILNVLPDSPAYTFAVENNIPYKIEYKITTKDGESYLSDRDGNKQDVSGVYELDSQYYYLVNGDLKAGELVIKYDSEYWYFKDGKFDSTKTGIVKYNGVYWYIKSGKWDNTKTGLAPYGNDLYYMKNGKGSNVTTFAKYDGFTWYVKNGKVSKVTTLVNYNGAYRYVKEGKWSNATTLVKYGSDYWYVTGGYMKRITSLVLYNDDYWYIKNGKLTRETTLVKYGNAYWYVKYGKLTKTTTLVKYNNKYWYVKNGRMDKSTTLVRYGNYYWYVSGGTTQNVTTLVKYGNKYYFVYQGKVNFNYTGTFVYNGVRYKIVKGVVTGRV